MASNCEFERSGGDLFLNTYVRGWGKSRTIKLIDLPQEIQNRNVKQECLCVRWTETSGVTNTDDVFIWWRVVLTWLIPHQDFNAIARHMNVISIRYIELLPVCCQETAALTSQELYDVRDIRPGTRRFVLKPPVIECITLHDITLLLFIVIFPSFHLFVAPRLIFSPAPYSAC
jgi:hypothetical protein